MRVSGGGYPRLAISVLLSSKFGAVVTIWAICCSTWVQINSGTSGRSPLHPMGNPLQPSVRHANLLVSRCIAVANLKPSKELPKGGWVLKQGLSLG